MTLEVVLGSIGLLCGAGVLLCLYVLAARKARKAGERPISLFLRCLAVFALIHGLGLVLVTAALLFTVPVPTTDREWMLRFIGAGCGFIGGGGLVLRGTGWFPAAQRA